MTAERKQEIINQYNSIFNRQYKSYHKNQQKHLKFIPKYSTISMSKKTYLLLSLKSNT